MYRNRWSKYTCFWPVQYGFRVISKLQSIAKIFTVRTKYDQVHYFVKHSKYTSSSSREVGGFGDTKWSLAVVLWRHSDMCGFNDHVSIHPSFPSFTASMQCSLNPAFRCLRGMKNEVRITKRSERHSIYKGRNRKGKKKTNKEGSLLICCNVVQ